MYTGGSGLCPEFSLSWVTDFLSVLIYLFVFPLQCWFQGCRCESSQEYGGFLDLLLSLIFVFPFKFQILYPFPVPLLETSPNFPYLVPHEICTLGLPTPLDFSSLPGALLSLSITPHVFIAILYLIISGTLSAIIGTGLFRVWVPSYAWWLHLSKDVRTSLRLFPAHPVYLSPPAGWGP